MGLSMVNQNSVKDVVGDRVLLTHFNPALMEWKIIGNKHYRAISPEFAAQPEWTKGKIIDLLQHI